MEQIRRTGLVTFFIISLLLFIPFEYADASERRIVYFFYNNPCASCKEEDKIYDLYKKEFSDEERRSLNYELRAVNLFEPTGKEFYEEICTAQEMDADKVELPVLVAGSRWVSSYSEIADSVRNIMEDSSWSTATPAGATESVTSEDIRTFEDKLSSIEKDNSGNSILFVTTACSDCEAAGELLNEAGRVYTSLNIIEEGNYQGLSALLYAYGIDEKEWKVPCLFIGDSVYLGSDEIKKATGRAGGNEAELNTARILMEKLKEYEAEGGNTAKQEKAPARWYQLLAEGILVGLNPCMISMLIMLLSVLITAGKSVLKTGLIYLGGKLVTYTALGIALFHAFSILTDNTMEQGQAIVTVMLAVLFMVLSIMYFADAVHAGKGELGKIRMQLPRSVRKMEHTAITEAACVSEKLLPITAFLLGIGISIGEFFCAGQLYMASIVNMVSTDNTTASEVLPVFLLFCAGIMLPSFILVIVVSRTGKAEGTAMFFARHEAIIKLLTAILFMVYAITMVVLQIRKVTA